MAQSLVAPQPRVSGFYSFVVNNLSGDVVTFPEQYLILDRGRNTFNTQAHDLEAFLRLLRERNVTVEQIFRLDDFEAPEPVLT